MWTELAFKDAMMPSEQVGLSIVVDLVPRRLDNCKREAISARVGEERATKGAVGVALPGSYILKSSCLIRGSERGKSSPVPQILAQDFLLVRGA